MSGWSDMGDGATVAELLRTAPDQVGLLSRDLSVIAETIREQRHILDAVDPDQFWEGPAAAEFEATRSSLGPLLSQAALRHAEAGIALDIYEPDLHDARQLALRALEARADAESALRRAEETIADQPDVDFWTNPTAGPRAALDDAEAMLQAALEAYADASDLAVTQIDGAFGSDTAMLDSFVQEGDGAGAGHGHPHTGDRSGGRGPVVGIVDARGPRRAHAGPLRPARAAAWSARRRPRRGQPDARRPRHRRPPAPFERDRPDGPGSDPDRGLGRSRPGVGGGPSPRAARQRHQDPGPDGRARPQRAAARLPVDLRLRRRWPVRGRPRQPRPGVQHRRRRPRHHARRAQRGGLAGGLRGGQRQRRAALWRDGQTERREHQLGDRVDGHRHARHHSPTPPTPPTATRSTGRPTSATMSPATRPPTRRRPAATTATRP